MPMPVVVLQLSLPGHRASLSSQSSLSSVLSDAPWLNRRRPGSLSSIIDSELPLPLL